MWSLLLRKILYVWWEWKSRQYTSCTTCCLKIYIFFLCIWFGDIGRDLPHTNNIYFIMYFLLSFICVIYLCLSNYHMMHLLSLLMIFYFQCHKTITALTTSLRYYNFIKFESKFDLGFFYDFLPRSHNEVYGTYSCLVRMKVATT
jgi:hypothetical protein